ncbi:hypothetical protein FRB94_001693 [Tulasnella sp. JGI-2019a]|nr:hypothetical protein FRB93_007182 [Tulasnella sp. JGI-2019a]KAG9013588.1 hypothetical protein FRB94_001693 [Tulasnella sp. JGI-2019a]
MATIAHHAPAVKVGGRRLSTSKHDHHKEHPVVEESSVAEADDPEADNKVDDYPRPTAPKHDDTKTKKSDEPKA